MKQASEPIEFKPELTPKQMLELGVFGGHLAAEYFDELPAEWLAHSKASLEPADPKRNFFGVLAGQPLAVWLKNGWIHPQDPLGWFQWYCRYTMGRRTPEEDLRQMKRWQAFRRHRSAVQRYCRPGDMTCRRRQRQALLQWAYDSRSI